LYLLAKGMSCKTLSHACRVQFRQGGKLKPLPGTRAGGWVIWGVCNSVAPSTGHGLLGGAGRRGGACPTWEKNATCFTFVRIFMLSPLFDESLGTVSFAKDSTSILQVRWGGVLPSPPGHDDPRRLDVRPDRHCPYLLPRRWQKSGSDTL